MMENGVKFNLVSACFSHQIVKEMNNPRHQKKVLNSCNKLCIIIIIR